MTITLQSHTLPEFATAIQKINSEDSPFDFRIRLFSPPVKSPNGYNDILLLWVDMAPARRNFMYYPGAPGSNRQVHYAEVPFPWISMLLYANVTTEAFHLTPAQTYHTHERVEDHVIEGVISPWLGNHSINSVCLGHYGIHNRKVDLIEALGFYFTHYFNSTFNHSTAPYLTSPLMHHFALMAGYQPICDQFNSYVRRRCSYHGTKICPCATRYQTGALESRGVHAAYKYLSRHEDFSAVVPKFYDSVAKMIYVRRTDGLLTNPVGYLMQPCGITEFKSLFGLANADEYRDLISSGDYDNSPWFMFENMSASGTDYNFDNPYGRHDYGTSLGVIFSEKDTVDILLGEKTVDRETNSLTKQRYDEFLYYLTGKNP